MSMCSTQTSELSVLLWSLPQGWTFEEVRGLIGGDVSSMEKMGKNCRIRLFSPKAAMELSERMNNVLWKGRFIGAKLEGEKVKQIIAPPMNLKKFDIRDETCIDMLLPYLDLSSIFVIASTFDSLKDYLLKAFIKLNGYVPYQGAPFRSAASSSGVYGSFFQGWGDQFEPCVDSVACRELQFIQNLHQLGELTRITPRPVAFGHYAEPDDDGLIDKQPEISAEPSVAAKTEEEKKEEENKKAWSKGVGYGSSYTSDVAAWNVKTWQKKEKQNRRKIRTLLADIRHELKGPKDPSRGFLQECLQESCFIPVLHHYCMNDSINDMSEKSKLYDSVYRCVNRLVLQPELMPLIFEENDGVNLAILVSKAASLAKGVLAYDKSSDSSDLKEEKDPMSLLTESIVSSHTILVDAIEKCMTIISISETLCGYSGDNPLLEGLAKMREFLDLPEPEKKKRAIAQADASDREYEEFMRDLCFDSVEEMKHFGGHKYGGDNVPLKRKLMKQLAREFQMLGDGMPIHHDSSCFFRFCDERMTHAQMLVIPCDGTPYGGGCFIFDVKFPHNYPAVPPKVNLATTGRGAVRFNPNLYECGYVCLSLLGTWQGSSQGEKWNPGLSTFLQVVISIQSLIFVPEPYYNEPGYESEMGTERGNKRSREYNDRIEKGTTQHAMIEMIENPPKAWEDVILNHFRMQSDRVHKNVSSWLGEDHPQTLKLRDLLNKLHAPESTDEPTKLAEEGA